MNFAKNSFGITRFLFPVVAAIVFAGCDSSGENVVITSGNNPLFVQQYDRSVARASTLPTKLVNKRFNKPIGNLPGWSACVDDNALTQYIDSGNAISFVDVGADECIMQAVKVTPGHTQSFSCFLSVTDSRPWSGMAISYYDAAGNFIAESDPADNINSTLRRKAVTAKAPRNAEAALAWFYTDSGGRIADCKFESTRRPARVEQNYRKTQIVERQFVPGISLGRYEGFAFSGYTELQIYPASSADFTLIDGFESGGLGRGALVTFGVTNDYLHVVVSIPKHYSPRGGLGGNPAELYTDSYPVSGDLWNDDSFEIYLNTGNERDRGYDANDFVRIYGYGRGAGYLPVTVPGKKSRLNLSDDAVCSVEGGTNRISCEVRFSLKELGIKGKPIAEIGFDVHVNADDDGGERDAKYSWCGGNTVKAWRDMSLVDCSLIIHQ